LKNQNNQDYAKARLVFLPNWLLVATAASAQKITIDRNKSREAGMVSGHGIWYVYSLVHVDVQLGAIISHNVAVGSKAYQDQYFNELPKTFNPKRFDPEAWAKLAKLAGMKYMVFTAKHHNGFCMWGTEHIRVQHHECWLWTGYIGRSHCRLQEIWHCHWPVLLPGRLSCDVPAGASTKPELSRVGIYQEYGIVGDQQKTAAGIADELWERSTSYSSTRKATGPIRWLPTMPGTSIRIC
jgi:hypothetical protein